MELPYKGQMFEKIMVNTMLAMNYFFTYFLGGLVYELNQNPNDAYLDYYKSFSLYKNKYTLEKLIELSHQLNMRTEYEEWVNMHKDLFNGETQLHKTKKNFDRIRDELIAARPTLLTQNYTGCLIDARGLGLKPILAPSILNEDKKKLYGIGVIPAAITNGAIVDYLSGDIEKAKTYPKIGNHPLVVKAINVVNESDVMISQADAMKLAPLVELLQQQKVAIFQRDIQPCKK